MLLRWHRDHSADRRVPPLRGLFVAVAVVSLGRGLLCHLVGPPLVYQYVDRLGQAVILTRKGEKLLSDRGVLKLVGLCAKTHGFGAVVFG